MIEFLTEALKSKTALQWQSVFGGVICLFLLYLFFKKDSRDERGRAIIGKASIITIIFFIVITSVVCQNLGNTIISPNEADIYVLLNSIQFLFNSVIFVEIVAILIIRKFQ